MTDVNTLLAMLLGAALLVIGLVAGYWRGLRRAVANQEDTLTRLDDLTTVGQAILAAQLNLEALCEVIYQQSSRLVDTRNYQIGLFDDDDYLIKIWFKEGERQSPQRFEAAAKEGLVGWIKEHGQGILVRDYTIELDTLPARPSYYNPTNDIHAAIFAPLIAGGKVIGIIAVQSQIPYAFSDNHLRRLTVLANQAAGSLRNAQLYEEAQAKVNYLQLIAQVSRQITAIQPLPNLFQQIVTLVHETFGYYAVSIFTIDKNKKEIVLEASSANEMGFRDVRLPLGKGIVGWVAQNAQMAVVSDVTKDTRYLLSAVLESTRSEMAVPLMVEQQVLGVLDVQSNQLSRFDKGDIFTIVSLAGQLSMAIQESQLYAIERRQTERLSALTEAARAVVSILDISDLLEKVIDLIDDHFGYDRVHLFLRSGKRIVFRSGSGTHSDRWLKEGLSYEMTAIGFIPWVARHGEPLVSGNVKSDKRYVVGIGLEDTHSEMTVPIQMGEAILGVFDIQSPHLNAFSAEDVALVQALADTVAIGLRNASLFANETRRRILAETLSEVSTVLASSLDLESVLNGILLGLERVVNYAAAIILLRNEEDLSYQISAVYGAVDENSFWDEKIPANVDLQPLVNQLLLRLAGIDEKPSSVPQDNLLVALNSGNQDIGHLALKRLNAQPFTLEEKEIVTTFANQTTIAIRNAQLYMAQKEEAWISTALLQVAEATGQSTSLEEVLHTIAHITPLLTGVEWCAILLLENTVFRVVEVSGTSQEVAHSFVNFTVKPASWPPLHELTMSGAPVILDKKAPRPPDMPHPDTISQAVLLPLFTKGEVTGVLLIAQSADEEPLTGRKIQLVSGIANQAAIAIESAQAYMAQQEEQWVTTVMLQVAEAVNGQYDLSDTLETVVRLMKLLVGLNWSVILRWEDRHQYFYGAKSSGLSQQAHDILANLTLHPNDSPFFTALMQGSQAVFVGNNGDCELPPSLRNVLGEKSAIGLPLFAQGKLVGAMLVDRTGLDSRNTHRQLDILTGIAYQTALAIVNARLQEEATVAQSMEREMEVARDIQMSLLPERPPNIESWDLAAYYRPARLVGGDFYDFIMLDDGRCVIVVADVADKGVPAAMFMATCRTLIRAVAITGRSPSETLEQVNRLLMLDNRTDLFFTCWYGILNPTTGILDYSSGGHNPPLLVHPDGKITELRVKGIAIGVLDTIRLQTVQLQLQPGDTLIAYTDGLTEAPRADMREFGEVELHLSASKYHDRAATEIVERIINAIDRFTDGQPAFDDLTLVVLKSLTSTKRDS